MRLDLGIGPTGATAAIAQDHDPKGRTRTQCLGHGRMKVHRWLSHFWNRRCLSNDALIKPRLSSGKVAKADRQEHVGRTWRTNPATT